MFMPYGDRILNTSDVFLQPPSGSFYAPAPAKRQRITGQAELSFLQLSFL
jgi:hypothetical protein